MPERFKVVLDHARRYTSARLFMHPISRFFQVIMHFWSKIHFGRGFLFLMHPSSVISANITINHVLSKTRFFQLHYGHRRYGSKFNMFDVAGS